MNRFMDKVKGKFRDDGRDDRWDYRFSPPIDREGKRQDVQNGQQQRQDIDDQQSSRKRSSRHEQDRYNQESGMVDLKNGQRSSGYSPTDVTPSVHQRVSHNSSNSNGRRVVIDGTNPEYNDPGSNDARDRINKALDNYYENSDRARDTVPPQTPHGNGGHQHYGSQTNVNSDSDMQRSFNANDSLRRTKEGHLYTEQRPQPQDESNYRNTPPQNLINDFNDYDINKINISSPGDWSHQRDGVYTSPPSDAMEGNMTANTESKSAYKAQHDTNVMDLAMYTQTGYAQPPNKELIDHPSLPRPRESSTKRIKDRLIDYLSRYHPGVLQDRKIHQGDVRSGYPIVDGIALIFKDEAASKSQIEEELRLEKLSHDNTKEHRKALSTQLESFQTLLGEERGKHKKSCDDWKAHCEGITGQNKKLNREIGDMNSGIEGLKKQVEGIASEKETWKARHDAMVAKNNTIQGKFEQHQIISTQEISKLESANKKLADRVDTMTRQQDSIEVQHQAKVDRLTDFQERRERELREEMERELGKLETKHAKDSARAKKKSDQEYQELETKSKKRIWELETEVKELEDEHKTEVNKVKADCKDKIRQLERELEDKERKTRAACENEIQTMKQELEGLSIALVSQESKYLAPNMSVEILRLDDGDVQASYMELVTMVEGLANLQWRSDQTAWTGELMERLGVDEVKQKLLRKRILKDTIWTHLHHRVFCSPFRAFGKEGDELEKQWNEAYGVSSDPRLRTKSYAWPPPGIETERWRYVTMKECRAAISVEHSKFDPRGLAKQEFTKNSKALLSQLETSLREIAVLDNAKTSLMLQLIVKATNVWLKHVVQRYRVLISVNNARCIPASEKARKFEEGSLDLVVQPELGRYGDANGTRLSQYTVISTVDMYPVSSLRSTSNS